MRYLRGKKVFFIDSRTTSDSVAYEVAKEHGLCVAENDIFLDNEKDVEYIKERIELLIERANQKGEAIGICHVHPATIEALREMFPVVDKEGIELVYASNLVK
ncbi:MAG: divergent polysaccharide deacetylase family protein [Candidatus Lindowbacteria bacterium]|nr:divergent polysaccharide deacetylase family protein [Candidatus Lindowbacteria bacterium]